LENNVSFLDALWCKFLWGFYPPGYEDLEKEENMKEVYTDLEKPGVNGTSFNLKLDQKWAIEFDPFEGGLIVGHDIEFIGEPIIGKDGMLEYKIKAISDKAKKMFIAE
jgi:hypothetical protein